MTPEFPKVCLVGEPGTGKTRLLRTLLAAAGQDSDAFTARGIQAITFDASPDAPGGLRLWDIAGASALDSLNQAFLSGVRGVVAMADAARPATAATALRLVAQVRRLYPCTPAVLLLNGRSEAARGAAVVAEPAANVEVFEVDALRGDGVHAALAALARRVHARAGEGAGAA